MGFFVSHEIITTLFIMIFTMIMFLMELIPVAFTAMASLLLLIITGVLEPSEAFSGFSNSSVLLFMAMFIVGNSLFVTGASEKIGKSVLKSVNTEKQTIAVVMVVSGIMSAFLSNTSTGAIFIPICLSICEQSGISIKKLLMGLVLAISMGGSLTLVGTPPNAIASSALIEAGFNGFNLFSFVPIGLPLFISSIFYYVFIGNKLLTIDNKIKNTPKITIGKQNSENMIDRKANMSVLILIITIFLMIFEQQIGIPFHVSAWIGAILNVFLRVITAKEAFDSIDISTIFLFVGTLALGKAMEKTGAGEVLAKFILSIVGDNPIVIISGILIICIVLTSVMSNTATAAMMAPIGILLAIEIGVDPRIMMMTIVYGCAASYGTPIGSPPNTMVYGIGYFSFMDFIRVGFPMILITIILSLILLPIFYPIN